MGRFAHVTRDTTRRMSETCTDRSTHSFRTPLILISGQQHRDMLIGDPLLTNRGETEITKPWTKWAYQPVQAKDVPAALVRAIATAMLPPAGPVYLVIPLDDWDQNVSAIPIPRAVSTRIAPDPDQVRILGRTSRSRLFSFLLWRVCGIALVAILAPGLTSAFG